MERLPLDGAHCRWKSAVENAPNRFAADAFVRRSGKGFGAFSFRIDIQAVENCGDRVRDPCLTCVHEYAALS